MLVRKNILSNIFLGIGIVAFLFVSNSVAFEVASAATPKVSAPLQKLGDLGGKGETDLGLSNNLGGILGTVIQGVLALVGMIFLILMIYAGFLWMTASGSEEKAEKARGIISMAVVGLVVIMAAYAVTVFVTGSLGSEVLNTK